MNRININIIKYTNLIFPGIPTPPIANLKYNNGFAIPLNIFDNIYIDSVIEFALKNTHANIQNK